MPPPSSLVAPALVAIALTGACDDVDFFLPVDPDRVRITVAVSGGLAGVDYALAVDGAEDEAVGLSCASSCPFEPGTVLLPLSSDQVAALAGALEEAGIEGWDGRDFGVDCCDRFRYDLTYRNGKRSLRVAGGAGRMPDDLTDVVRLLHGLAYGVVPALIAPDTRDTDWPRDSYVLGPTAVEGLELTAEMEYGGGCAQHRIDLVVWGDWIEMSSSPPHINALLTHDDGGDTCEALLSDERTFDLTPLRDAYEGAFVPIGHERPVVVLRLWDPQSASPLGRLVEVRL
ncbi:MAG: hypothetical protein R3304_12710 [Longimicrobiales bacterium]|nr:hypothetical protein [Longimicrobiales bacterium]